MSDKSQPTFQRVCDATRETALLASTMSLLGWDERTLMPMAEAEHRAQQMTLLAGMIHRRNTDPELGHWLDELIGSELAADPHSDNGTIIRQTKRQYDKQLKLPPSLVKELTRTAIEGQQVWQRARADSDFESFRPILEKIIDLKRQEADALGYDDCRYDALLDEFEPQETTANVRRVLGALRDELVPLIQQIVDSGRAPDAEILRRRYPVAQQQKFGSLAAARIGFDFDRGRLDATTHPFCSGLGPHDTRITTRYDEHYLPMAFFGILHEAGHGIYEQGLRTQWHGLPPGESVSLGIHESQSRLWENQVGRSRSFWQYHYPSAQSAFSAALSDVSLEDFYYAINHVRPSLVRVEADEATYNLHILIRFELEQALLDDVLPIVDLPQAWSDKYHDYLGIRPPTDAEGVLQDIHWSSGSLGYFPTYSLGNLYGAQFFACADEQLGGLAEQFAEGQFEPLRRWLGQHIHQPGQCYTATELVERVTGKPLSHQHVMDHLRSKLEPLYGRSRHSGI